MKRTTVLFVAVMALVLTAAVPAGASDISIDREIPASVDDLRLANPISREALPPGVAVDPALRGVSGTVQVVIRLSTPASSQVLANQAAQMATVNSQQDSVIASIRSADGGSRVLARAQRALNAVIMEVDAATLADIAALSGVVSINQVRDYELDLTETVPYIGATAVQDLGYDGSGIEVAVLDSGIDYLHANLGGSGDPDEFAANDPTIIEKGTFPTPKVVGGFDFVGPNWVPGLVTEPDPDPLDAGSQRGHGTHVADIIAGVNGVAPGASLHAVKVCSSESTSCSGIALIQGMDYAVDPNGDGDTSDHVDIVNMSLGSLYGQWFDDDLSVAVENATAIGVLTVASAGNSADKPYITGTPSAAPSALSVAQTNVPSAVQPLLQVTAPDDIVGDYAGVFQPWSAEPTGIITGEVVYADSTNDSSNLDGCLAFDEDLTGFIVLVDRGGCTFTSKILNVEAAGGIAGIIGLVAPGDPFAGGFGGEGFPVIPGYMISQADSDTLKGGMPGVEMTIDPAFGIPLIMHMVGSSSRGPEISTNTIKPEIGAPGASVSAEAGTGTEETPFGGTSGAAPMVSGSAALLIQAYPDRTPAEIKSVLMNTGETDIMNIPEFFGGDLAPITRIGGGEVRVDAALAASGAAWDSENLTGALSFGAVDVHRSLVRHVREVTVANYTGSAMTYNVSSSFRYADDADNGAVSLEMPGSVTVPAHGTATFDVKMVIDGAALRDWGMSSGSGGSDGDSLTTYEYDGYIDLTPTKGGESIHVAWQVLPRKSNAIKARRTIGTTFDPDLGYAVGQGTLHNDGVATAVMEAFSLIGRSPDLPEGAQGDQAPVVDLRYVGVSTIPVPAGFCSADDSYLLRFAINTWEPQAHSVAAPGYFEVQLDTDQDGVMDYAILNFDLSFSGALSDGRNVTWSVDLATGDATAFFFTEHNFNSGNTVLTICGEQIGQNAANFFQPMTVDALAIEWYFQGVVSDAITGMEIAPLGERYLGFPEDIAPFSSGVIDVLDFGPVGTNPSESGLLVIATSASGAKTEAFTLRVRPDRPKGGGSPH